MARGSFETARSGSETASKKCYANFWAKRGFADSKNPGVHDGLPDVPTPESSLGGRGIVGPQRKKIVPGVFSRRTGKG